MCVRACIPLCPPTQPPPALAVCFVSFSSSHPPSAGSKHWRSLSCLGSSFRSRGSGGWENVVQECQALSRKPGFCFVSLLNRSRFLFLSPSHKQPPGPLCPFFMPLFTASTWDGNRGCGFGNSCVCCPILVALCREAGQMDPTCGCLPLAFACPNEGIWMKAVRLEPLERCRWSWLP